MTDKVDLKKTLDSYRAESGRFRLVEVPDLRYLMVDGHGGPNTAPTFAHAIEALYPVAYKLKFAGKRDLGRDYVVMPLEGLWWAEDMDFFTASLIDRRPTSSASTNGSIGVPKSVAGGRCPPDRLRSRTAQESDHGHILGKK